MHMPANHLSVIRSTTYKGRIPDHLAYHTQNKVLTTHMKSGMQKEEDYAVNNTEAGGIYMTTANNSSSPINPTHNYHGRLLSSYHDSEGYNHNNALILHGNGPDMVDYMLNDPPADPINNAISSRTDDYQKHQEKLMEQQPNMSSMDCSSAGGVKINNVDRTLSFADVMQFADFGPKLALNHPHHFQQQQQQDVNTNPEYNRDHSLTGIEDDNVYFLKFPVLNNPHMVLGHRNTNTIRDDNNSITDPLEEFEGRDHQEEDAAPALAMAGTSNKLSNFSNPVQLEFLSNTFDSNTHNDNLMGLAKSDNTGNVNMEGVAGAVAAVGNNKSSSSSSKKKRPRTIKTNEEVESQRMTHIAVERNRRKQMNEHLRVLRSLMPSSYVQRGDQASIIGGAIEFVRELEQLLQCLESQKRRRLYGDQVQGRPMGDSSNSSPTILGLVQQTPQVQQPLAFPPPVADNQYHHQDNDHHQLDPIAMPTPAAGGLVQEETAESKSCVADIEVKVLGFDALIKILSRRRPGQLIKAIAALEDLHFTILHTNITTIEQTVLYSFNVKVASEGRFTAEDIAGSVQQIFTFIHANTSII